MISVFENKGKCSGCTACSNVCPKKAIKMVRDKEGFLYPEIDANLCIDCGLCKKVCPIIKREQINKESLGAYAVQNLNEEELQNSTSGGIATILSKHVLELGGYVCGCIFTEQFKVEHVITNRLEDLKKLSQSKYVQSNVVGIFPKIKELLEQEKTVLFIGNGCQVNGLLSYLKRPYKNLITLDFVCFGAPSPKAWDKYVSENDIVNRVSEIKFRDKKEGWGSLFSLRFKDGNTKYYSFEKNDFCKAFDQGLTIRPSCYECAFKGKIRNSDFTCADLWGIEKIDNTLPNVKKGYSLLLIHSIKGAEYFESVKDKVFYKSVDIDIATKENPMATASCIKAKNRDAFMQDIDKYTLKKLNKKYYPKKPLILRIKIKLSKLLKH